MPRTVVYDHPMVQAHLMDAIGAADVPAKPTRSQRRTAKLRAAKKETPAVDKEQLAELPTADSYLSKIAKYVPAETVSITLAAFAAFNPDGNTIWVFLGVGAVANVIYLLGVATNLPVTQRPRAYFYGLSALAFLGWAIAVIQVVQLKVGIKGVNAADQEAFILAATAFVIPALDSIFGKLDIHIGA